MAKKRKEIKYSNSDGAHLGNLWCPTLSVYDHLWATNPTEILLPSQPSYWILCTFSFKMVSTSHQTGSSKHPRSHLFIQNRLPSA